jgi:hypothetical protein
MILEIERGSTRSHCVVNSMVVTGKRGKRRKQLVDYLQVTKWCWKLKEEVLDRALRWIRFGRSYGPVVRQPNVQMNELMKEGESRRGAVESQTQIETGPLSLQTVTLHLLRWFARCWTRLEGDASLYSSTVIKITVKHNLSYLPRLQDVVIKRFSLWQHVSAVQVAIIRST